MEHAAVLSGITHSASGDTGHFFEENKDKDYNFKIDPNVNLAEQNIDCTDEENKVYL